MKFRIFKFVYSKYFRGGLGDGYNMPGQKLLFVDIIYVCLPLYLLVVLIYYKAALFS